MTVFWILIFRNQIMLGMLIALLLFVPWRKRRKLFWFRFVPLLVGAVCLSNFAKIAAPYFLLVFFAVVLVITWVCFDCGIKHALFAATCAYCVQHITSKLAFLFQRLLTYVAAEFMYSNFLLVCGLLLLIMNIVISTPIFFLASRRVLINGNLNFDSAKILFASAAFILVAVFISYYIEISLNFKSVTYLMEYCCLNLFCILFGTIVLLMNFMNCRNRKLEEEKSTLEQLFKKNELQYEQAKLNMERINIRYHDLKQQHNKEIDEIENSKLDDEIKNFRSLYFTGNKAVDITLSEKASMCAGEGIQFVCSVNGSCLDKLKPYHIYSLLGNAIDNAVECLRTVDEEEKKVLNVDLGRRGEMSVIRIRNYAPNKLALENGIPKTTKSNKENHGFGIKSIRNIAEEYSGEMYIDVVDNTFNLIVAIPNNLACALPLGAV